jgi:hypothetical protein
VRIATLGHESGDFSISLLTKRGGQVLGQSGVIGSQNHSLSTVLPPGDYYLSPKFYGADPIGRAAASSPC